MHWFLQFRLDPLLEAETHAHPLPANRMLEARLSGRQANADDVDAAMSDLLDHALYFVEHGEPGLLKLQNSAPGAPAWIPTWRYVLRLASGVKMVEGFPFSPMPHDMVAMVMRQKSSSVKSLVQAHAVILEGNQEFVERVDQAVRAMRAWPGLLARMNQDREALVRARKEIQDAEERIEDLISRLDDAESQIS